MQRILIIEVSDTTMMSKELFAGIKKIIKK